MPSTGTISLRSSERRCLPPCRPRRSAGSSEWSEHQSPASEPCWGVRPRRCTCWRHDPLLPWIAWCCGATCSTGCSRNPISQAMRRWPCGSSATGLLAFRRRSWWLVIPTARCAGPAEEDIGHCRANLAIRLGQDWADEFLAIWQDLTGKRDYHPYWDLTNVVSFDHQRVEPRLDAFVAAAAARL